MSEWPYYIHSDLLPREVIPDRLWWVGGCANSGAISGGRPEPLPDELSIHEGLAAHLILGSERTMLVDGGHFSNWYTIEGQLEQALKGRNLDYVFVSHQELPHTGNVGRLLTKYPEAVAVGDTRDYHLYHPSIDRSRWVRKYPGDTLDLGDDTVVFLRAIWKDLTGTMWTYSTRLKAIFSSDFFGYGHSHLPDRCGKLASELEEQYWPIHERYAMPFNGMGYHDQTKNIEDFRELLAEYPIDLICSGHTCVIDAGVPEYIEAVLSDIATKSNAGNIFHFGAPLAPQR